MKRMYMLVRIERTQDPFRVRVVTAAGRDISARVPYDDGVLWHAQPGARVRTRLWDTMPRMRTAKYGKTGRVLIAGTPATLRVESVS